VEALGELNVRWIAEADSRDIEVDEYSGAPVSTDDEEKTEESDSE